MGDQELQNLLLGTLLALLSGLITSVAGHWLALARDKRREALRRREQEAQSRQVDCEDEDQETQMEQADDDPAVQSVTRE